MDEYNKPSILLVVNNPEEEVLRQILAGIEEEGLPRNVVISKDSDYLKETHKFAKLSKLGVCVGVYKNRVILHYNKLKENNPIIDVSVESFEVEKSRNIGNNAARLYKVMPLKNINISNEEYMEEIKAKILARIKLQYQI